MVSNPPYVAEAEWPALTRGCRQEPHPALVAGPGSDGTPGLADVEAVLGGAAGWLARPGAVVVEMAPHQAAAAVDVARRPPGSSTSAVAARPGRPGPGRGGGR